MHRDLETVLIADHWRAMFSVVAQETKEKVMTKMLNYNTPWLGVEEKEDEQDRNAKIEESYYIAMSEYTGRSIEDLKAEVHRDNNG